MGQMPATIFRWLVDSVSVFGRLFRLVLGLPMYYTLPIVLDFKQTIIFVYVYYTMANLNIDFQ